MEKCIVEWWGRTEVSNQYVQMPFPNTIGICWSRLFVFSGVWRKFCNSYCIVLALLKLLIAFKSFQGKLLLQCNEFSFEFTCYTSICCGNTMLHSTFHDSTELETHLWFILLRVPLIPFKEMSKILQNNSLRVPFFEAHSVTESFNPLWCGFRIPQHKQYPHPAAKLMISVYWKQLFVLSLRNFCVS